MTLPGRSVIRDHEQNVRFVISYSSTGLIKTNRPPSRPDGPSMQKKPRLSGGLDRGAAARSGWGQELSAPNRQTAPAPLCSHQAGQSTRLMLTTLECWRSASRRVRLRVGAVSSLTRNGFRRPAITRSSRL
jgi:hypothetical protein